MLFPTRDLSSRLIIIFSLLAFMLSSTFLYWVRIQPTQNSLISFAISILSISLIRWLLGYTLHKKRNGFSDQKIRDMQCAIAIFDLLLVVTIYFPAATLLSYGSVYVAKPLVNKILIDWDHSLGFDWLSFYHYNQQYPSIVQSLMRAVYISIFFQLPLICTYLCIIGKDTRIKEYLLNFIFSSLICIALATYFPSDTAFHYYNLNQSFKTTHFDLLRQKSLHFIDLYKLQGLVCMPSFHAVLAICLSYAARGLFFSPVILIINSVMLYATLLVGGHYLVDVIAGVLIAAVSIVITYRIMKLEKMSAL